MTRSLRRLIPVLALACAASSAAAQTPEQQVVELVNIERWNNGQLPPLRQAANLDASAELHCQNMADRNFFAHCDVDMHTLPWDRMTAAGYAPWSSAAENIAAGYGSPAAVMTGWMNSPGHRSNILSTSFREIGVGFVNQAGDQANLRLDQNNDCTADAFNYGPYGNYWTQNFGRISTVYPVIVNREAYQATTCAVALYVYGSGWAQEMRFRNESGSWSNWQPYTADAPWQLSAGNGTKTVTVELRNGATIRTASDTIQLASSANLALALGADPGSGTAGTDITYTLTLVNNGPYGATGLEISQALPAGVTFVSASGGCTESAGVITCPVGSLDSGQSVERIVVAHVTDGGVYTSSAVVTAPEHDPDLADNSALVETTIAGNPTGVAEDDPTAGSRVLLLGANRPNPFHSATTLSYALPRASHVRLTVHDATGRRVATLVDGAVEAGAHAATWLGRGDDGAEAAAGFYFLRLEADGEVRGRKVLLAR